IHAPWTLAKDPSKRMLLDRVLYRAADSLRLLAIAIYPFMPSTAEAISQQLGVNLDFSSPLPSEDRQWYRLAAVTMIQKANALSPRIQTSTDPLSVSPQQSRSQGAKPVSDAPATPQSTTSAPLAVPTSATPASAAPEQITIDEFMKIQLKTAKVISAE